MKLISTHEITGQHYSATLALDTPTSGYIRITPAIVDSDVLWSSEIGKADVAHYATTRSASLYSIDMLDFERTLEDRLANIVEALNAVIAVLDNIEQGEWVSI